MGTFEIKTTHRKFIIEAAGIGDAIDQALKLIVTERREGIMSVEPVVVMILCEPEALAA